MNAHAASGNLIGQICGQIQLHRFKIPVHPAENEAHRSETTVRFREQASAPRAPIVVASMAEVTWLSRQGQCSRPGAPEKQVHFVLQDLRQPKQETHQGRRWWLRRLQR